MIKFSASSTFVSCINFIHTNKILYFSFYSSLSLQYLSQHTSYLPEKFSLFLLGLDRLLQDAGIHDINMIQLSWWASDVEYFYVFKLSLEALDILHYSNMQSHIYLMVENFFLAQLILFKRIAGGTFCPYFPIACHKSLWFKLTIGWYRTPYCSILKL